MAGVDKTARLIEATKAAKAVQEELDKITAELLALGDGVYEGTEKNVVVKDGEITIVLRNPGPPTAGE